MGIESDCADGLALYGAMQTIRSFEPRMAALQAQGIAPAAASFALEQAFAPATEAVIASAVGLCAGGDAKAAARIVA